MNTEDFKKIVKQPSAWQPEQDKVRLAVLGKLAEELAEASAIVARCIIQGIDEYEPQTHLVNRLALADELADVRATVAMAADFFELNSVEMAERQRLKTTHLHGWHTLLRAND